MTSKLWIYANDMSNRGAKIVQPDSGEVRSITAGSVRDRAPCGLRLGILEEEKPQFYREVGEFASLTDDLFGELEDAYNPGRNSWMFDWPHYQLEMEAAGAEREQLIETLNKRMSLHPYDFEILGLQRRFLIYQSDGNTQTQQKFVGVAPPPNVNPYLRNGQLRRRFRPVWDHTARDQGVPYPKQWEAEVGHLRAVLYCGPAYVLRFMLDKQVPAFGHCLMYVMPDGTFIGSDWCQRHDYTTYSGGINLQMGIYEADTWITNSCVLRAIEEGVFQPKKTKFEKADIRELLKKSPMIVVPTLDEAIQQVKAEQATKVADPLRKLVEDVNADACDQPTPVVVDMLIGELETRLKDGGDARLFYGLPFLVKKLALEDKVAQALESLAITETTLSFVAGDDATCPEHGIAKGMLCLNAPKIKQHHHVFTSTAALDYQRLRVKLTRLVEEIRTALTPIAATSEEVGPITADVIQEAEALARRQDEERLLLANADLIAQALRIAGGLVPVEAVVRGKVSSEHPTGKEYGRALFTPLENGQVVIEWRTGKFSSPEKICAYEQTAAHTYVRRVVHRLSPPAEDVAQFTPAWYAAEWYFEKYRTGTERVPSIATPDDLRAQATMTAAPTMTAPAAPKDAPTKAEAELVAFTYEGMPYSGRFEDADRTTAKITDLVTSLETTVQRAANGHVYEILPDGSRILMDACPVKSAAQYFFKTYAVEAAHASAA